jgi:hypothetical protein
MTRQTTAIERFTSLAKYAIKWIGKCTVGVTKTLKNKKNRSVSGVLYLIKQFTICRSL